MIQDLGFYLKLLSRRFPAMAALFMLCACIGVVIALRLPTVYSTQATLLVEAAQVPSDMVRATAQINTDEQLEVVQQRLMTRANLIDVARTNRVFPNQSEMNPDDIVSEMRRRTTVRRSTGRNKANLMIVRFEGPNPKKVADVVNQYVTIILEASNELRTGRAEGTLEFFEQEVETLSQSLDAQSAKIVNFKNKNSTALPESLDYRLSRQSLLQERLVRAERDLKSLESQSENIQRVYESTGNLVQTNAPQTAEQQRLNALQSDLNVALGVYSESHPRVKLLRTQIANLESQMASAVSSTSGEGDGGGGERATALEISLAEIEARAENLRNEIEDTTAELERLRLSIDQTPANRIALEAMERDQQNLQNLYSAAVTRLSQARMGERIELSAKGERITVLEPATVPTSPSGPNRPAIMAMGVGGGMALAGGLFVLLELLNTTIRRPADITRALNITPLATVPRFETLADRRRRRTMQLATLVVIIIAVPTSLWAVDTYYMPLDLLFEKVINRLT